MTRIWDAFLTPRDKAVLDAAGYGARQGFGKRPALLVIDVSYAFTGDAPEPILQSIERWPNTCGEEAWSAVKVIASLLGPFRSKNLPVIYTTGAFRSDNWDGGGWLWKHGRMSESTEMPTNAPEPFAIVDEIAPEPGDLVLLKQKPSAFFGTNLLAYLILLGCDSLIVTGGTTSGCVRATALDAFSHNFRVSVVEDGCFDRAQASHALSLCDLNAKYADVVSRDAVADFVSGLGGDLFPNLPPKA